MDGYLALRGSFIYLGKDAMYPFISLFQQSEMKLTTGETEK